MENIGKTIQQLRKEAGLTQVQCAQRVGVGLRFLRDLEQGKTTVRLDKVAQVCRFFGYHMRVVRDER